MYPRAHRHRPALCAVPHLSLAQLDAFAAGGPKGQADEASLALGAALFRRPMALEL